jgi:predicted RNA binding protein YcfA (HicA-like mRNA interferase family)
MVSEQPTRVMVNRLARAGFTRLSGRGSGSHEVWKHLATLVSVSVPEGHRTISPGVVRKIDKAIEESNRFLG